MRLSMSRKPFTQTDSEKERKSRAAPKRVPLKSYLANLGKGSERTEPRGKGRWLANPVTGWSSKSLAYECAAYLASCWTGSAEDLYRQEWMQARPRAGSIMRLPAKSPRRVVLYQDFNGPSFGSCLRDIRKRCNLTLTQLAEQCGLDPGNLSRIERGSRKPPSEKILARMIEVLGPCADADNRAQLVGAAALSYFKSYFAAIQEFANADAGIVVFIDGFTGGLAPTPTFTDAEVEVQGDGSKSRNSKTKR